jgi:hypothetical protein
VITITHEPKYSTANWPTRKYDTWRGILRQEAYALGLTPPNYPVPALIGIVTMAEDANHMSMWPADDCDDYPLKEWYIWNVGQ